MLHDNIVGILDLRRLGRSRGPLEKEKPALPNGAIPHAIRGIAQSLSRLGWCLGALPTCPPGLVGILLGASVKPNDFECKKNMRIAANA